MQQYFCSPLQQHAKQHMTPIKTKGTKKRNILKKRDFKKCFGKPNVVTGAKGKQKKIDGRC